MHIIFITVISYSQNTTSGNIETGINVRNS